jgi:hypothetical protein
MEQKFCQSCGMPPTKNHSTFTNMLRQPGCDSFYFTFEPNGQMANTPNFIRIFVPKNFQYFKKSDRIRIVWRYNIEDMAKREYI